MSIILEKLTKQFGALRVVDRVTLEVADAELFVLLGGSGSGKSTILRMIAGLTEPSGGRVWLHGRDVTPLPPQQRGTGFVFQNYSIFRHMNIAENVEFGLKIRGIPVAERARRRDELLHLVGLAGLGDRYSDQLSGGQRQRVALARALAYEPSVLLLDEPFGALDVKIRAQLRRSLREIQQRLGVTTILVTHDQEEAFELGDRIGVMERGHLLEVGEPEALYRQPRSAFVATFLGAGTVLAGRAQNGEACFGSLRLPLPPEIAEESGTVQVLIRPEQVTLSEERQVDAPVLGQGTIAEQSFVGAQRKVRLRLPRLAATRQVSPVPPFGEEGLLVDALVPSEQPLALAPQWIALRGWHLLEPPQPRLLLHDDGHAPLAVLRATQRLAEALDATTRVFGVVGSAERELSFGETLAQRVEASGLVAQELRVRIGEPDEEVLTEQAAFLPDFFILAGAERLDGTTMAVLDAALSPVLVLRGPERDWQRVLICTAAGEPGKSDVRVGGRLARRLGAEVDLLHVTTPAAAPTPLAQSHLDRGQSTLSALDLPAHVRVREAATAAEGILAEAQEGQHDVIVLGSHGPQARSVFGLDDVTLQVLKDAPCSVLIVPMEQ